MMMLILYFIPSLVFLGYIFLKISWKIKTSQLSFLPSPHNVPWLGSLPYLSLDPRKNYQNRVEWSTKFNHLYVMWIGSQPRINAGRVEYVEPMLRSRDRIAKSAGFARVFNDWLGTGLFTAKTDHWKKRRVQLTGAFHFSILNDFMDIYEQHANNLVNHLKQLIKIGENVVEVQELMGRVMLDVICETSMGVTANALESAESKYVRAVDRLKTLMLHRFVPSFWNHWSIYPYTAEAKEYKNVLNTIHTFIREVINQNMTTRKNKHRDQERDTSTNEGEDIGSAYSKKKKRVFIDILLDLYEEGNIDIKGIEDEVNTFMFAGHDTTSVAISWILYEIGRHPEIQMKLQEEIDEIEAQGLPMVDKIRSLKYTECVIKESLRVHPPAVGFSRYLEEDMTVDGHTIPAGTVFHIDVLSMHLNPEYWPDPNVFDPSRFQAENSAKRNPYCFIPFSAGVRGCIGQKFAMHDLKVFLFTLMLNFSVVAIQEPEELEPGTQIITSSMNGIHIKFSRRDID